MSLKREFCPVCNTWRPSVSGVNHILHLLVSLFLIGLWAPVWLMIALTTPRRCTVCAAETRPTVREPRFKPANLLLYGMAGAGVLCMALFASVVLWAMFGPRGNKTETLSQGDEVVISSALSPIDQTWAAFADNEAEAAFLASGASGREERIAMMVLPDARLRVMSRPEAVIFQGHDASEERIKITGKLPALTKDGRRVSSEFTGHVLKKSVTLTRVN